MPQEPEFEGIPEDELETQQEDEVQQEEETQQEDQLKNTEFTTPADEINQSTAPMDTTNY